MGGSHPGIRKEWRVGGEFHQEAWDPQGDFHLVAMAPVAWQWWRGTSAEEGAGSTGSARGGRASA